MNRWFSSRGARRGLMLSGFVATMWLCWALGFTQGSAPKSAEVTTPASPFLLACCTAAPRT